MKEYIVKADFITEGEELVSPDIVSELIRCKDCRWFRNDNEGTWCVAWAGQNTNPDAFCSYAQPKERGR